MNPQVKEKLKNLSIGFFILVFLINSFQFSSITVSAGKLNFSDTDSTVKAEAITSTTQSIPIDFADSAETPSLVEQTKNDLESEPSIDIPDTKTEESPQQLMQDSTGEFSETTQTAGTLESAETTTEKAPTKEEFPLATLDLIDASFCENCSIGQNNGMLQYSYGVSVPEGRLGLTPQIYMYYSQLAQNTDSMVTKGWDINFGGYIEQDLRKGAKDAYESNEFKLSLGGNNDDLRPVDLIDNRHGQYGAKTEETFYEYEFKSNETWLVTDTAGTVYTFGSSSTSRQDDPNNPNRIYRWMLESVEDTHGNTIDYTYFKDSGQIYPKEIFYSGYKISFEPFASGQLTERPDKNMSYQAGFEVITRYLLDEITISSDNVSPNPFKKYGLSYDQQGDTMVAELRSIQEFALTDGQWETLPAVEFEYKDAGNGWGIDNGNWSFPDKLSGSNKRYFKQADVNNDGFEDFLYLYSGEKTIYLHNGIDGWEEVEDITEWMLPSQLTESNFEYFLEADINNDGLEDYLFLPNVSGKTVYLHNGVNGWEEGDSSDWDIPDIYGDNLSYATQIDINNDGLEDIIYSYRLGVGDTKIYLNNGANGWGESGTYSDWNIPYPLTGDNKRYVKKVDINNDGLPDYLSLYDSANKEIYLNNGINGWDEIDNINDWKLPSPLIESKFQYFLEADINNDGLNDFIYSYNPQDTNIYLHNGVNGWEEASLDSWDLPGELTYDNFLYFTQVDINNTGTYDLLYNYSGTPNINKTYVHTGTQRYSLASIDNNYGGKIEVEYKNAKSFHDYEGFANVKQNRDMPLVYEIKYFDRGDLEGMSQYDYAGGEFLREDGDPWSRVFAGYHIIQTTDMEGNYIVEYFYQGGVVDGSAKGEYEDHISKRGKPYRREVYDANDSLLLAEIYKYESEDLGDRRYAPKLTRKVTINYEGQAASRAKADTYKYDQYGNLIETTSYGEVDLSNQRGEFNDIGTDKIVTTIQYAENTMSHIVSLPKRTTIKDQLGAIMHGEKTYYDELALGLVDKGDITKREELLKVNYEAAAGTGTGFTLEDRNEFITTAEITYGGTCGSYGTPDSITDTLGNTTIYQYDTECLFLSKIISPSTTNESGQTVAHEEKFTYDYRSGQITELIDQNGNSFKKEYDGFGRLVRSYVPNDSGVEVMKTENIYIDDEIPRSQIVKSRDREDLPDTDDDAWYFSYSYFDGLGRVVQENTEAEDDKWSTVKYEYDTRGNLATKSMPEFESTPDYQSGMSGFVTSEFEYDALNRIVKTKIRRNNGSLYGYEEIDYGLWMEEYTDMEGKHKEFEYDARGNLIEVREQNNGEVFSTFYEYDSSGNLVKITDAEGNTREMLYDSLGKQLALTDLHYPSKTVWGTDFGVNYYKYDNGGNLVGFRNMSGDETVYSYDELNRILIEDLYSTDQYQETVYYYDDLSVQNGIGRLANNVHTSLLPENAKLWVGNSYTYDTRGNIQTHTRAIRNESGGLRRIYEKLVDSDLLGRVESVNQPGNYLIRYEYNEGLNPEKIYRKNAGMAEELVVSNLDYSPAGQMTKVEDENGVSTINTYDSDELYRLTGKLTTDNTGEKLQDLSYEYDKVGNVVTLIDDSDTALGKTTAYSYDDLYRLTSVNLTAGEFTNGYTRTYQYSPTGNILYKSDQGYYKYAEDADPTSTLNPQAVMEIYDEAGNLSKEFKYDTNGNLVQQNLYDSNGNLIDVRIYKADYQNRLYAEGGLGKNGLYVVYMYYDEVGERVLKFDLTHLNYNIYVMDGVELEGCMTGASILKATYSIGGGNQLFAREIFTSESGSSGTGITTSDLGVESSAVSYTQETLKKVGVKKAVIETTLTTNISTTLTEKNAIKTIEAKMDTGYSSATTATTTCPVTAVNGLYYSHPDHLGSSSVVTDESSSIAQLVDYYPYGETRFEDLATDFDNDYLYTGKEYDEESSLYYYGARYYDPKIARFTSIDPWEGDLKDPQSLNKYAYVRNNPLKYVDPSGENWNDPNEFATKVIPYIDELQRQLYDVANLITLGTFEQAFDNMQTAANNMRQEGVNIETLANTAYQVAKEGLTVGGVSLIEGLTIGEMWMTGKGMMKKKTVYEMHQPSVSTKFSEQDGFPYSNQSVKNVIEELKDSKIKPSELPINYATIDETNVILNNRSYSAVREAGLTPEFVDKTGTGWAVKQAVKLLKQSGGEPFDIFNN